MACQRYYIFEDKYVTCARSILNFTSTLIVAICLDQSLFSTGCAGPGTLQKLQEAASPTK